MKSNELRAVDHDPITSELSTFGAHKYFNQGTINDTNIQKVTINSNSRVSPLLNMDTEQKHNQEQGDITKWSFSHSSSSSVGGIGNGNHNNNNYNAHSFHVATPTPPPSSSKSTLNNKAGLLLHHPQTSKISVKPPQTSSNLTKKLKTSLSKPIWLLRRKCPCKDKKSVQVKVNINTNKNKNRNTPKPRTPPPQPKTLSHNQIHKDSLNHKAPPPPPSSNKKVKAQRLFQFQPSMNQLRKTSSEGFTFPLFLATNSTNPTKPHHPVHLNVVHEEEDATHVSPCTCSNLQAPPSHVPWMMMQLVMQVLIFLRLKASPLKLLHFHTPLSHPPLLGAMNPPITSSSSPTTPAAACGGGD
ncbi:hypothetical protein JHK87_012086 [Glycine soja]|nr:hypothetical protein JHK87_012086 [Glycine soja]